MTTPDLALAEELLEAVGSLRRQVRGLVGRPWPDTELRASEMELIRLVRRHPSISINDAAAALGLAANSVSMLVRRLVDAEMLVRVTGDEDRRVVRLMLTPQARQRVERWRDHRHVVVADALAGLTANEQKRLQAALPVVEKLVEQLRASEVVPA